MTNRTGASARELCSAFEQGELGRDEYWASMREQHLMLEQYSELLKRGDVASIEIHRDGLRVVFEDGLKMQWRPSDTRSVPSVSVNHGAYEAHEVRALCALAEGARVVLDIGANAGFMALRMARGLAPGGVVYAFEPVPSTHAELVRNVQLNGLGERVSPRALALGEAPGHVNFYVPAFHGSVAASARPLFASDENREVTVEMTTLDAFAAASGLERVDLVKCDVEGAELLALRGGLGTIERTRPVLMLEMLRKWSKVYGYHPNDIIALLAPLGYRCFSLGDGALVEHERITDETLPTNFFFLDPERHREARRRLERPHAVPAEPASSARRRSHETLGLATEIRKHCLRMVHRARASHVGSCLSIADILAVLYADVLSLRPHEPCWARRDRFVLSKGHAAAALYAVLAERGFFPREWLLHYCEDGGRLAGHVVHKGVPGVELSTGSLGHGLSVATGIALAGSREAEPFRAFVLMSDGECDEGSVWEAALFAGHHRLANLTAIVDYNEIQSFGRVSEVLSLAPFADKWRAFGWDVVELDGHDVGLLQGALAAPASGRPRLVMAHTVKGKGVSFMEDQLLWHYRSPSDDELARALVELEARP